MFQPKMERVPEGDWFCYECQNKSGHDIRCVACGAQEPPKLVKCHSCPKAYHLFCIKPPLISRPKGRWKCGACWATARPGRGRSQNMPRKCRASDSATSSPQAVNENSLSNDEEQQPQQQQQQNDSQEQQNGEQQQQAEEQQQQDKEHLPQPKEQILQQHHEKLNMPSQNMQQKQQQQQQQQQPHPQQQQQQQTHSQQQLQHGQQQQDEEQLYYHRQDVPYAGDIGNCYSSSPVFRDKPGAVIMAGYDMNTGHGIPIAQNRNTVNPRHNPAALGSYTFTDNDDSVPPMSFSSLHHTSTPLQTAATTTAATTIKIKAMPVATNSIKASAVPATTTTAGTTHTRSGLVLGEGGGRKVRSRTAAMTTTVTTTTATTTTTAAASEGGVGAREREICSGILNQLMSHPNAWPFLHPVNTRAFPQYRRFIKNPMDFGTMREKMKKNRYKTLSEFASDARQVFINCEVFNEDDSDVGRAGHTMSQYFEEKWAWQLTEQLMTQPAQLGNF